MWQIIPATEQTRPANLSDVLVSPHAVQLLWHVQQLPVNGSAEFGLKFGKEISVTIPFLQFAWASIAANYEKRKWASIHRGSRGSGRIYILLFLLSLVSLSDRRFQRKLSNNENMFVYITKFDFQMTLGNGKDIQNTSTVPLSKYGRVNPSHPHQHALVYPIHGQLLNQSHPSQTENLEEENVKKVVVHITKFKLGFRKSWFRGFISLSEVENRSENKCARNLLREKQEHHMLILNR